MTTATLTEEHGQAGAAAAEAARPDAFGRILNFDLTQPIAFVALAIVYVASRAPFINIGYGTDPDAWRVALSGYWLWDHGEFYPSRLPGYPIPEYASAAVIKGGWLATNSMTLAVSLLGLWFFARIVAKLELPNRALLVAGFAFTPLLWNNSMKTMDYMYALTFVLGAYFFLLRGETVWAGLTLGLAAASRSTSVLMLVPFMAYMWRDGKRGETRDLVVFTLIVPVLAYLPIAWKYGPGFLTFYDAKVGYLNVMRLLGKDCLGLLGSITVLLAFAISLPRLARLPGDAWRDKNVMVWVIAIAIGVAVFLRLPHESAYLIPIYPFGFFLMAKYFQRIVLTATLAMIVFAGFVDLTSPGDEINASAFTHAHLGQGLLLSNRDTMRAQIRFVHQIENYDVPDNTVVSLGFVYPQFAVLNRDNLTLGYLEKDTDSISQLSDKGKAENPARKQVFVWLLDYADFQRYQRQGYNFMYTLDAGRSTAALYDYRPSLFGASLINIGPNPSGGSGAARTDR
jgi:hypothetical protein